MDTAILYIHILLASIWIGGMITLVGFIIYTKGEKSGFFYQYTTYYGWLNIFVLSMLIVSGLLLLHIKGLFVVLLYDASILTKLLWIKISLVLLMIFATAYHSFVVLKVRNRTKKQNILSKISSFYLLFSSIGVLYVAISLRDIL